MSERETTQPSEWAAEWTAAHEAVRLNFQIADAQRQRVAQLLTRCEVLHDMIPEWWRRRNAQMETSQNANAKQTKREIDMLLKLSHDTVEESGREMHYYTWHVDANLTPSVARFSALTDQLANQHAPKGDCDD
jgi:hypothetical protein